MAEFIDVEPRPSKKKAGGLIQNGSILVCQPVGKGPLLLVVMFATLILLAYGGLSHLQAHEDENRQLVVKQV